MSLTDRSRLGGIKSRQKRLQRKLRKLDQNSQSASTPDDALVSKQDLTAQKKAWEKYLFAKSIYEETRDSDHWRYMQKCISEYENALKTNLGIKAI
ncbi:hypothetical protein [Allocoleopsis franciscana]|uniref:Uncharacterized protein n=1 Tax=Allocoleopsis franciscana PCC 7113 TaxID=1173027 RepID=K9WPE2_9CYAN|nr:hypothetical protein [Allocoleopsis franciscana]AFZ21417.1 hypothetical protein Mic7113_5797 [Allocoleopsis franciscana PCC 7113]